nr:NAD-dependent epimerase/dehydratase family protein [Candidatus Gracilibacteria bacterium]
MTKILITGATGQIGTELVIALREKHGSSQVVAVGHPQNSAKRFNDGPYADLDICDRSALEELIKTHQPELIYHLVGILSATGEKNPLLAWQVNMEGLKNVLDLSLKYGVKQVFWPSSIAAFGPTTPLENTPQHTVLEPTTMYGVTKVSGELLCQYYWHKYGLDVRSIRYPGIISYKTAPGGGTTDYAVAIYFEGKAHNTYNCFVREDTILPMMYMPDAIRATIQLMESPAENIKVRTSYNLTAMSFSAQELAENLKKYLPDFSCQYQPDERQKIADSWPKTIDDSAAQQDW